MKIQLLESKSSGDRALRGLRFIPMALGIAAMTMSARLEAFSLTTTSTYHQVDTGAGLVFKIRGTGAADTTTTSPGDIMSLVWNGVEYQNSTRGSQINSGFDWLYKGVSAVNVTSEFEGPDFIKVTVTAGDLTHYYVARRGYPHIYMATTFTTEPSQHGLVRYVLRMRRDRLPNGPAASDVSQQVESMESGDIYRLANGETRSKHYSNNPLKDWTSIGATGPGTGIWVVRDNQEGGSGGPFYRSLSNQATDADQEITYIVNYGEGQTEAFRPGIANTYTLVCNSGEAPPSSIDTSFFGWMGINGYLPAGSRGRVSAVGISGRVPGYNYTVGFSNATAQYWANAAASNGYFDCRGMRPGTYEMTIYKNELEVKTVPNVVVTAGATNILNTQTITGDPEITPVLWRIGKWDGRPSEFLHGNKVTSMHPSDVRITGSTTDLLTAWKPGLFETSGTNPGTALDFPCYLWSGVNSGQEIRFNLTQAQKDSGRTVRIGVTCGFGPGRPQVQIGGWSSNPALYDQPDSRSLTVGTYRGNNRTYTVNIPSARLVVGQNTMRVFVIGNTPAYTPFLTAGISIDCIDMPE